jgi:hypothetical protein
VSVGAGGAQATGGDSFDPAPVSESGRFVAFTSGADGLATGDINPTGAPLVTDVFLRDLG